METLETVNTPASYRHKSPGFSVMNMSNTDSDWEIIFSYQLLLVGADPGGEFIFKCCHSL